MDVAVTKPTEAPAGGVDRTRLMAHIAEFAKRIKLSGTPEELESFRYLEATMRGYGYRTQLLQHDAYISLPGSSRLVVDGVEIASITHSMSVPTGPAGIRAPLVYVGEGEQADFDKADVAGKIVLVEGVAVEDVADRASKAGALAEIHISPTEHLHEMCISTVWGSPSQLTLGLLPTVAAATVSRHDGAKLRARCLAGEGLTAALTTEVETGWRQTPLLVCDLDAPEGVEATPFILFSGHHDSWHYGVMDNGSANATMLEAARVLAENRSSWRRGLRVCFWSGHSHGRYSGSAWYADEHFAELDWRCAAHVNVDSTGGIGADVLGNNSTVDELQGLAARAIAAETGQLHAGHRHGRVADQSFWGIGVPSMYGSLSHQPKRPGEAHMALGWWWHTPHDLADKIDPDGLVRDTRIVLRTLWHLLTDATLPFDYAAYAENLLAELGTIETALAGRFDIASLKQATAALKAAAALPAGEGEAQARRIDEALIAASRLLVPINYTSGDRFRPDPARTLPSWPALQCLRELADAEEADKNFYVVEARRARNRVLHALQGAADCLNQTKKDRGL
ncbi:M28 family peptidase [Bosea sp. BK604]|uniref:M28 family peptidase n=1 Tax=Bosea sp. BK604 TaxID=2512180 RepID=UPI001049978F|nr:M28 family peptidase [Bosea sp. BK604]TCR66599.1 Zn-dependent M28 family amino/carboxypeptidase [Bosea sp. BK604]